MPRSAPASPRSFRRFLLARVGVVAASAAIALAGVKVRGQTFVPKSHTDEANITRATASLLGHSQFSRHPLDGELASEFLDSYLDALDGTHSVFLQSDIDGFAHYRSTLARATRVSGDTSAAQTIFGVYLERLAQRTRYAKKLLDTTRFDFSRHDTYSYDRDHTPWPRDLGAAKALWREQLRAGYLAQVLDGKAPARIAADLKHRYQQELDTMQGLKENEVLAIYLDALAHVYDPHSDYLSPEEMESFSISMNLSLYGIGAALENSDGYCTIRDLVPGGPAAQGGELQPGDRILAVAQAGQQAVPVTNMPLSRVVELIRGPKGTKVVLSVLPAGEPIGSTPRDVAVVRDQVQLKDQEAKASIVDLPQPGADPLRVGVIDLPSFYTRAEQKNGAQRSASADVALLLEKLEAERVRGIVLDLRHNGGGSLAEAVRLTGLFIRKGPIVQTRDSAGKIQVDLDPDPGVAYDGPLVLLTSRFSASASEILAGALQDYGRAVIVGDSTTFGKGTVQTIVPLAPVLDHAGLPHASHPGAIKVTIQKFYRPGGASTQLRGVRSDIVLPSTSDVSEVSESALQGPLPWDAVRPTSYERVNRVAPYLPTLRAESAHRTGSEPAFSALEAEVAALRKNLATKTVSLNLAQRQRELEQTKERESAWERLSRELGAQRPVTHLITLENASQPGLPPPLAATPPTSDAGKSAPPSSNETGQPIVPSGVKGEDVILDEAEHILADYIRLLGEPGVPSNHWATREPR